MLVQSGKFEHAQAEALVDTIDATTKEPATRADLEELRGEIALLGQRLELTDKTDNQRFDALEKSMAHRFESQTSQITLRVLGVGVALLGAAVAAFRLI